MPIGEPTISVVCDRCDHEEVFDLTPLAGRGWDDRNVKGDMARAGWSTDGEEAICEDCRIDEGDSDGEA